MNKIYLNRRTPEILAGIFMIIGSIVLGFSFISNLDFLSFFSSISDDFEYLSDNDIILKLNSFLWILSSLFIITFSCYLLVAMKSHNEPTAIITAVFFILSAVLYTITGIKGLSILELLSWQQTKVIDESGFDYITINILSLTKEKEILIRVSNMMTGFGLLSLGIFGIITSRISYIPRFLLLSGGLILPVVSVFFNKSAFHEASIIILLIALFALGTRLAFSGFIKRKKQKISGKNAKKST